MLINIRVHCTSTVCPIRNEQSMVNYIKKKNENTKEKKEKKPIELNYTHLCIWKSEWAPEYRTKLYKHQPNRPSYIEFNEAIMVIHGNSLSHWRVRDDIINDI